MFDLQPTAADGLKPRCKDCSHTLCKTCHFARGQLKGSECSICRNGGPLRLAKQRALQADIELVLTEIGNECYIGMP